MKVLVFTLASIAAHAIALPTVSFGSTGSEEHQNAGNISTRSTQGKHGLPYNDANLFQLFSPGHISWGYNWASTPGQGTDPFKNGQEYCPMLFNGVNPTWDSDVKQALSKGSKHLLAMNEPDQDPSVGGTNISPKQAAKYYKEKMNKYKGKAKLGAPAVSASGINWLSEFVKECNGGCHVDFVPLHFYDTTTSAKIQAKSTKDWLQQTIPQVRAMFKDNNMPIWLTEFAALPDVNINVQLTSEYMKDILPWLDSNDAIERYSYFIADELTTNNQLNGAGKLYNGN